MLYFGRRGRENIHELTVGDFAATTDSDGRVFIYLTKDEQTKNHQNDPNSADGRMYAKSDDPLCPVKSFMKYKRHLNPKCKRLFQRPNKGESPVNWYINAPLGHNAIGDMMPTISSKAGLSKRYTNHSLRTILDSNEFASRHITSVTGHKAESSLKTYTGYTSPNIKRKMSDTISESLSNKIKEKKVETRDKNKEIEDICLFAV
ncbi:uncharacterized protein LOC123537103 [Mercenaria mercenaria]|uniref:uncharacterized protein LOC123537103 n=1 Tax=Mercenaria mercenaria TaxID=6596 RepID=UPI00234EEE8B|nr:uncharacterized protein LOC123537103 [Mercenaria mercenaria]